MDAMEKIYERSIKKVKKFFDEGSPIKVRAAALDGFLESSEDWEQLRFFTENLAVIFIVTKGHFDHQCDKLRGE